MGAAVLAPIAAAAQAPTGDQFRINTYTPGEQRGVVVARGRLGQFVAVWASAGQDGSGYGIFAQRYDVWGVRQGAEFRVNSYTTGDQYLPSVGLDQSGGFVVVWTTLYGSSDGSGAGVHGQRFYWYGAPEGAEFIVNTYTTGDQYGARVSVGPRGDFVVVWESAQFTNQHTEIVGQRYDLRGGRRGAEFQVNQETAGWQFSPDVNMDRRGAFAVVWTGPDGDYFGIWGRLFGPDGTPAGPEFLVNAYTRGMQHAASVHGTRTGDRDQPFVVAWQSVAQDGDGYGVFARRFDADGNAPTAEVQVNAYATGSQGGRPVVAMDEGANFVVSWTTQAPQDGSGSAAVVRRFTSSATPRDAEMRVNTYTSGDQDMVHVGSDRAGNFVAAWRDAGEDGSGSAVAGRRVGALHPAFLDVLDEGNGMLEPGETATLGFSWRNYFHQPWSFGGVLGPPVAPAGCVQAITDATADYGTAAANGMPHWCADCYSISTGPDRCTQHWDIRTVETLTPDVNGQARRWVVHVGRSFTDVPPTSRFYWATEAVLHHGVTAGCGGAEYCPLSLVTREQLPVFVLRALEGEAYRPPPCAPPNTFGDVPETSPFCPWIEELARRGVIGGCSANPPLYCPSSAVTREQMALFLFRTREPQVVYPCEPPNVYDDVPETNPFCPWIEALAAENVVTGCSTSPPLYCPRDPVARQEMAAFLMGTYGLLLYDQ